VVRSVRLASSRYVSYTAEKVGTMLIKVVENRLDAVFLTIEGTEFDKFTILKDAGSSQTVYTCFNEPVTLTATWPEELVWNPGGATGTTHTVTAFSNAIVTATDPLNCVQDIFNIVIVDHDSCSTIGIIDEQLEENLPSLILSGKNLFIQFDQTIDYDIFNASGKKVHRFKAEKPEHTENLSFLNSGIYFLKPKQLNTTFKIYIND
jgi:hypothetical protein